MHCTRCDEPLPDDSPLHVLTCRAYAVWRARIAGSALSAAEADALTLLALVCELAQLRVGPAVAAPRPFA